MSTRPAQLLPGYKGGPVRVLTEADVLARREAALAMPPGPERSRAIKRAGDAIRRVREFRKD